VERRRAETVLRVCYRAGALDALASADPRRVRAVLTAIPGVGPWTEATVRLVALGDPDAVPVGDVNFPARVAWVLAGERQADDARMLELLAPFPGHRGRVLRLVTSAGPGPPRHGPRRANPRFARY
jgi:3-methyladenine DNA glycosylase/8-oxoguanine DNA glycosylase